MSAYSQAAILQGIADGSLDAYLVLLGAYQFQGGHLPALLPATVAEQGSATVAGSASLAMEETFLRSTFMGSNPADSLALFHSVVELLGSESLLLQKLIDQIGCIPTPEAVIQAAKTLRELAQFARMAQDDLVNALVADDGSDETLH